jgi:predicted small lipoprotein YifL
MSRSPASTPIRPRSAAAARIIVVLMVAVMLAGCGKRGNPSPPPGEPNTYPRTYPSE